MELDPKSVDYVLTTTRSVRLRLDFDRPVDPQIILDCIDIAEQAPTGGNIGSRRWIVITDPKEKAAIRAVFKICRQLDDNCKRSPKWHWPPKRKDV